MKGLNELQKILHWTYNIKIMELISNINRLFRILGTWFYLHLYLFYVLYILTLFTLSNVQPYTLMWKGSLKFAKALINLRRYVSITVLFLNVKLNELRWKVALCFRRSNIYSVSEEPVHIFSAENPSESFRNLGKHLWWSHFSVKFQVRVLLI